MVEAQAIAIAKASGHSVTGEQDELKLDGIVGHRDCVIDGCIVDVKSSATQGMAKFETGSIEQDDLFGYLDQLDCYLLGSIDDPLVEVKDKAYLFAIDKTLGHMALHEHRLTDERTRTLRERIERYKRIVVLEKPPTCNCGTVSDGEAGNIRLDIRASYSPYKHICFPQLRTFLYAKGPVFLTRMIKRPFNAKGPIAEVDKFGNFVYN